MAFRVLVTVVVVRTAVDINPSCIRIVSAPRPPSPFSQAWLNQRSASDSELCQCIVFDNATRSVNTSTSYSPISARASGRAELFQRQSIVLPGIVDRAMRTRGPPAARTISCKTNGMGSVRLCPDSITRVSKGLGNTTVFLLSEAAANIAPKSSCVDMTRPRMETSKTTFLANLPVELLPTKLPRFTAD